MARVCRRRRVEWCVAFLLVCFCCRVPVKLCVRGSDSPWGGRVVSYGALRWLHAARISDQFVAVARYSMVVSSVEVDVE